MRMQVNGSKLIGKRQTRVKILKDTIAKWQDRGEGHGGYRHLARENMARWKTGEAPKTTFTLHVEEMDTLDLTARLTKEYKEMFACQSSLRISMTRELRSGNRKEQREKG